MSSRTFDFALAIGGADGVEMSARNSGQVSL